MRTPGYRRPHAAVSDRASVSGEYHLVRFEGSLDISRYPEFRKAFEGVPSGVPVLVDLTAAEDVDSTFLTEMLMAKRRHSTTFSVLIAPAGNIAKVFEITGLDAKMNVYQDLSTAVKSLGVVHDRDRLEAE